MISYRIARILVDVRWFIRLLPFVVLLVCVAYFVGFGHGVVEMANVVSAEFVCRLKY